MDMKYPVAVLYILGNEFCERFAYYGMRTILSLYLRDELLFTDDRATVIFHIFVMLCYFTPIFGAIIADTILGRFRTIFYISIIYAIGNVVISLGATPALEVIAIPITMLALFLIAVGTGGIKPCVSAFGGDQFVLPDQELQQKQFFSLFYFSINAGSLLSTIITPKLRQDVNCFGKTTCYSLAFGVPAILMITAVLIFLLGKSTYRMIKPEGNVILETARVIKHAVEEKIKNKEIEKDHWLDFASDKYDQNTIDDIKCALKILFLFLPLPIFWTLFDQQGSRWTFQATIMDGTLGPLDIKPDQIQLANPLLILVFIPIFEYFIYPMLGKLNLLKKSISRIFIGGILAATSFVISALVEIQLEKNEPKTIHMFWLLPQYVVITAGEVMFSITGLEFAFTQAPASMKSVMQAAWLLTVAFGNLIAAIIAEAKFFKSQTYEFLLCATLMVAVMVLFLFMARGYKYFEVASPADEQQLGEVDSKKSQKDKVKI